MKTKSYLIFLTLLIHSIVYAQEWQKVSHLSLPPVEDPGPLSVAIDNQYAVLGDLSDEVVYVYYYNGESWVEQAKLTAGDKKKDGQFAASVDISGDVIVVGSYAYQQEPEEEHVAYVFVKPGREWKDIQPTAILSISDKGSWRGLEESVSIYGNTIAINGNGEASGGGVYVYEMPTGGWKDMTETAKLTASDAYNSFPQEIRVFKNTIAANVLQDWSHEGAVYVFERPISGWKDAVQNAKLTPSNGKESEYRMSDLSITDDVILAINNYGNADAITLFERPKNGWVDQKETAKLIIPNKDDKTFGTAISISGSDIVAGAFDNDTEQGENSGIMYLFEKSGEEWKDATLADQIIDPNINKDSFFGYDVDLSNNTIITCTPSGSQNDNGLSNRMVYFFKRNVSPQLSQPFTDLIIKTDTLFTLTVSDSTFVDENYDKLTYTATLTDGKELPTWLSFDKSKGVFSGTPASSDVDSLSVRITAIDPQQAQANADFQLIVQQSLKKTEEDSVLEETENEMITSINNEVEADIKLYPNPSSKELTIVSPNGLLLLTITNVQGEVILSQQNLYREEKINISNLAPGLYTAILQTNKDQTVRRLTVRRLIVLR